MSQNTKLSDVYTVSRNKLIAAFDVQPINADMGRTRTRQTEILGFPSVYLQFQPYLPLFRNPEPLGQDPFSGMPLLHRGRLFTMLKALSESMKSRCSKNVDQFPICHFDIHPLLNNY